MSEVVDLAGDAVAHRTLSMRSNEAKEALAALLEKIESGDIQIEEWLFVYTKQNSERSDIIATNSMDSGLSVSQTVYLMESYKFDLMLTVREATR